MSAGMNGLAPEFASRLASLFDDCGGLTVTSGRRSTAEQTALWNASDQTGVTVARPGSSNHERGEAADLAGNLVCAHAKAAAHRLRFPMAYEPWHIERDDLVPGSVSDATTAATGGTGGSLAFFGRPGTALRLVELVAGAMLILMGLVGLSKALSKGSPA
jgi:hypothetical protein